MEEFLETTPQKPPQRPRVEQIFDDLLPAKLDISQQPNPRTRRFLRLKQPQALPAEETTRRLMTPLSNTHNKLPLLANTDQTTKSNRLETFRPKPLEHMQRILRAEDEASKKELEKQHRVPARIPSPRRSRR